MKTSLAVVVIGLLLLCGCADLGPAVAKSNAGNLEINLVAWPEGLNSHLARLYVDDVFVGNITEQKPVLLLRQGKRTIRVELEGAQTYVETVTVLGEPNHQVLNVALKKKAGT
jgi:hypothetical protein